VGGHDGPQFFDGLGFAFRVTTDRPGNLVICSRSFRPIAHFSMTMSALPNPALIFSPAFTNGCPTGKHAGSSPTMLPLSG
jgi:hypothetical protein